MCSLSARTVSVCLRERLGEQQGCGVAQHRVVINLTQWRGACWDWGRAQLTAPCSLTLTTYGQPLEINEGCPWSKAVNGCSFSLPPSLSFILRQWFASLLQKMLMGPDSHSDTCSKHQCKLTCHMVQMQEQADIPYSFLHLLEIPAWISLTHWHTGAPMTLSRIVRVHAFCAHTTFF